MSIGGVSIFAVLVAGIAGFMVGGIWYGVLSRPWMEAAGLTQEQVSPEGRMAAGPMIRALLADIVIAAMLAGVMERYDGGAVTIAGGLVTGGLACVGFALTTLAVNHGFGLRPLRLTIIDGGHWLLAFLVMGGVIGAFG
jgi:hypothetical protein